MNGASVPVTATRPRRLVLHFDINKTIVMKDTTNNVNNATLTVTTTSSSVIYLLDMQHFSQLGLGSLGD
jgi:hypothetical protein